MQNLMPPVNTPDKLFHNGDPTQGLEGTIVTAEWLNDSQGATRDAQQEIINVLAAVDIEPDTTKQNQLLTAIQEIVTSAVSAAISTINIAPDIGELYITTTKTNPETKYPGTSWEYLGEGLTLRTAKADGSNVGTTTGADNVTLEVSNLPSHNHSIGGSTGGGGDAYISTTGFDYGVRGTSGGGAHNHGYNWRDAGTTPSNQPDNGGHDIGTAYTTAVGDHSHTVSIGAHSHNASVPAHSHGLPAATGSNGNGASFSVVSKSILVAVWKRTA